MLFLCVQDELKVMEEVKAKQEKEDEKKCEESESGSVSLKSPGKVRKTYYFLSFLPLSSGANDDCLNYSVSMT